MKAIRNLVLLIMALGLQTVWSADVLRIQVQGYRLSNGGEVGELLSLSSLNGLEVKPTSGHVYKDAASYVQNENVIKAVIPFGYRLSHWVRAFDDPFSRTRGEKIPDSDGVTSLTVPWSEEGQCVYLALVLEYDNDRTITIGKSQFGEGSVGHALGTYTYQKGDVIELNAVPAHDASTGFDKAKFRRWSDGSTASRRKITVDTNAAYVAEFVPLSWKVTFDPNGGVVIPDHKTVTCGATYGVLPVPSRTGYEFASWRTDEQEGQTVGFDSIVRALGPHTLVADWLARQYEIGWQTVGKGNGRVDGTGRYDYGVEIALQAVAFEGSQFAGWPDGETRNPRRVTVLSNATYTAQFDIATYAVTFSYRDVSGELLRTAPEMVAYGSAATPPELSVVDAWPEHEFVKWDNEGFRRVSGDLDVHAIYDAQTFAVRFVYRDRDGNSVTSMPQNVVVGSSATPPPESVYNNWIGHKYAGWSTDYFTVRGDLVVEALYDIKNYKVTYFYHNAEGKQLSTVETVEHGQTVQAIPETAVVDAWPGHHFLGWSNDKYLDPITCDLEVFAKYEGYCLIRYVDAWGAVCQKEISDPGERIKLEALDALQTLEDYEFAKLGYLFDYWQDADGRTYDDAEEISVKDGEVVSLTSHWAPIRYTISYDANGGILTDPTALPSQNAVYDSANLRVAQIRLNLRAPVGSSVDKAFWTLLRDDPSISFQPGQVVSNLTTVAGSNVVLYAYWPKESYKVTLDDGNGGVLTTNLVAGSDFAEPPAPERTGYDFVGWFDGDTPFAFGDPMPAKDIALTAHWTPHVYTVLFDGAGGTNVQNETSVTQTFTYDEAQQLRPNEFKYDTFLFSHWTNEAGTVFADCQLTTNLTTESGVTQTLWAVWKDVPSYQVRYNPNGGTGESYVERFECGKAVNLMAVHFTRTGYTFAGWATNATSASVQYADEASVTDLAAAGQTRELYAVWSPNRYWVAFNANATGGMTGSMEAQAFVYDAAQALMLNAFDRTGYTFAGWVTNVAARSVQYADGAIVSNLTAEAEATRALYAKWTPIHYTLRVHGDSLQELLLAYDSPTSLVAITASAPSEELVLDCWTNSAGETFAKDVTIVNLTTVDGEVRDLYPKWREKACYWVKFDGNGADEGSMADQKFYIGGEQALASNAYGWAGHVFISWTNAVGTAYKDGQVVKDLSADGSQVTLYANWKAQKFLCYFDGVGEQFDCGANVTRTNPTKVGYAFTGWLTNGVSVMLPFKMPANDVELTSTWSPIEYTVIFDKGNPNATGKADRQSIVVKYDVPFELPGPGSLALTGFEFGGWTNVNQSVPLAAGTTVSNLTTTAAAQITYYAYWSAPSNPLGDALGTKLTVRSSAAGAWTSLGPGQGLQRSFDSPDGDLEVDIPGPGQLSFNYSAVDEACTLELWFNDVIHVGPDGVECIYTGEATGFTEFTEKGTLKIKCKPEEGYWQLQNFIWEPAPGN